MVHTRRKSWMIVHKRYGGETWMTNNYKPHRYYGPAIRIDNICGWILHGTFIKNETKKKTI